MLYEVFVGMNLSTDEAPFKVSVDNTGSLGSFSALSDGPALDLVFTSRKVMDELEGSITGVDDFVDHGLGSKFLGGLVTGFLIGTSVVYNLRFELGGVGDHWAATMLLDVASDLGEPLVLLFNEFVASDIN